MRGGLEVRTAAHTKTTSTHTKTTASRTPSAPTEILTETLPGGLAVVTVRGELTRAEAPEFRAVMLPLAEHPDRTRLALDASCIPYLDSEILGVLIECARLLRGRGGALAVCGASPFVRRAFEITRLCRAFEMADSVEDARGRMSGAGRQTGEACA